MEESKEAPQTPDSPSSSSFIEVTCKSTGIVRRFAPGTKAGFAISLINNKLDAGTPLALYIEAVKLGEEPINFGPTSLLFDYGADWKLQTVVDSHQGSDKHEGAQDKHEGARAMNTEPRKQVTESTINFLYIGKIVVAFLFIFLLCAVFTLALEFLPNLMLLINSSL